MKKLGPFHYFILTFLVVLVYFFSAKAVALTVVEEEIILNEASDSSAEGKGSERISLLSWSSANQNRQAPSVLYDRLKQFGKWAEHKKTLCKGKQSFYDTRALVLIRDSQVKAISTDDKPCTIEKGEWVDPYSGRKVFDDDEVQIDHMVPLKAAYDAGAYKWSQARRCVYANFMEMDEHLISTSNFENQSKSDKTPEKYMPPLKEYHCTYLKNWLSVKLIWKLGMTSGEVKAIRSLMKQADCHLADFTISQQRVSRMRRVAKNLEASCPVPRLVKPRVK